MYVEKSPALEGFQFEQSSGKSSQEFYLISHPGYCLVDDEYMDLDLRPEDHFSYSHKLFNELERKIETDAVVAVLEEEGTEYSRNFLGDYVEEVDHFFETVGGKARPTTESAEEFIDVLKGLEDGALVTVAGEVNGLCVGQAGQITQYVSDAYELELDIERGIAFPGRPVERPGDELVYVDR